MKKKTGPARQSKVRFNPAPALTVAFFFLLPFVVSFTGLDKFRTPKEVFGSVFIAALVGLALVGRRLWPPRRPDAWTALLALTILFCFAHAALAVHTGPALRGALQVLFYAALLLVLADTLSPDLEDKVWLASGLAMSVNAVLTVLQYYGLFPLMERLGGEQLSGRQTPAGLIGDVNSGAFLFGLICLIAIHGVVTGSGPPIRLTWCAIGLLNLLGLAFTRTLTAIFGLAFALLLWLVFHHWWALRRAYWSRVRFLYLWAALLAAAGGAAAVSYRAGVVERIALISDQMARGDWMEATAGRQPVYQITWRMIQERPILGRGLNSFGLDFFSYRAETEYGSSLEMINQPGAFREVHNEYLQAWEETGVVGLVLFGVLFFWPLAAGAGLAFRSRDADESYRAGVWTVAGMFVAFSSLTFFPFHVTVTASYVMLLLAGLRRMVSVQPEKGADEAGPALPGFLGKKWIKPVLAAALFVWLTAGQVEIWLANREMGVAAFLLETAVSPETDLRRSRLFADEALGRLDRIDSDGWRLREFYNLRGAASMLLGRHASAIEWYEKSTRYLPSPETYTNLAAALMAAGEPARARPLLETALRYNPSYEPARLALRKLEKDERR